MNHQKKKGSRKKGKKKNRNVFKFKVFTPKSSQECVSFLFQDFDEKTGILKITDDVYSICMEYTDISFAKANDEECENIFFKWLEYLHSFREDNHIQVVNASTPVKTEKFKEKFVFDTSSLKDEKQKQIAEELNTLITNSLGTNEETLLNKRYIVISLKAKSFIEANALFLNIYLKTEQKFKELKSKVRLVTVKERLRFIYDYLNLQTLEEKGIDNICLYAKENKLSIYDAISPKAVSMRESDFIEIEE